MPFSILSQIQFTNLASDYGIDYSFLESNSTFGAGISLVDFNGDGYDDISFGTHNGLLPSFYQNLGDTLLIPWEHTGDEIENGGSRSLIWIDYDNDGDKDLSISNTSVQLQGQTAVGTQKLYRRDGDTILTDVTLEAGWTLEQIKCYSIIWADYDNDGWLDCHISRTGLYYCPNILYRNLGNGTFEDVTAQAGVLDTLGRTLASIFFDADLDGDVDLFVSNDRLVTQNKFYVNNGDGTFTDRSQEAGLDTYMDGMGIAQGDYDLDGDLDLYLANLGFQPPHGDSGGNMLFENQGDGTWVNVAEELGIEVFKTSWGVHFTDLENDGDQDIIVVSRESYKPFMGHDLFINEAGEFTRLDYPEFEENYGYSFGSAVGDFNGDGLPDFAVARSQVGKYEFWRNDSPSINHWIKIHLQGTVSNRDAIGSYVEFWSAGQRQVKFTTAGNSYASQDSDVLNVGLGPHELVDSIIVHWPSGLVNIGYDLSADTRYDLIEDSSEVVFDCNMDQGFSYINDEGGSMQFESELVETPVTWDFGDGAMGSGYSPAHQYAMGGEYWVCMSQLGNCLTAPVCDTVTVVCEPTPAEFFSSSEYLLLEFAPEASSWDSLRWDFGDGAFSFLPEAQYEYLASGTYEVCLTLYSHCGVDTVCDSIDVECAIPDAGFNYIVESLLVSLVNASGSFDSTMWDLGEFGASTAASPIFQVPEEGYYPVCIEVFNSCGSAMFCDSILVECPIGVPSFTYLEDGLHVAIENLSTGYDSLTWIMGDGAIFESEILTYEYPAGGLFELCLVVHNPCGSDSSCVVLDLDENAVGVHESLTDVFRVFPNPAVDRLFVELADKGSLGRSQVWILDSTGREQLQAAFYGTAHDSLITLDMTQLRSGIYFLHILQDDQHFYQPIIKY